MSILLTASIFLLVLWPAYAALLKYSERYALNRFLLVLAMVAVCALPFVSWESPTPVITQSVQETVEYVEQTTYRSLAVIPEEKAVYISNEPVQPYRTTIKGAILQVQTSTLVYLGGVGLMLLLLGGRLLFLLSSHLRSRPSGRAGYRLLATGSSSGQAFTFGTNIYFSEDVPEDADFDHILTHERVHARQLHSVDIMLTEVFLCIFWFHPVAWWLRTKMRANLEYLVDKAVVNQGADRRNYQLALVRQSVASQGLALALPFSEPSLKSRIARMAGMPEYRLIGILAAVALTFWLGVAMVVVNGNSGEDAGAGEYLAAVAGPGDPYYAHYQNVLSEPVTSLEVYTNRMVTGDEYLQLRAILAKVPGAKLYAFKQHFDRGYSLELRIGHNEPSTITHLLPDGTQKWMYMFGVEQGGAGDHIPVAMNLEMEKKFPDRDPGGMIRYLTSTQSNSDVNFFKLSPSEVEKDLLVYVNREPVSLSLNRKARLEGFIATDETEMVNDVDVLGLTTSDWPKVVTEGRQMPTPRQRIMDILHIGASSSEMKLYRSNYRRNHTYRQWFENLELPGTDGSDGTGMARRYNDQFAQLDFLLDTDFGPNSLIQVAHRTDEPGGMIVVQVIDDTPKRMIEASLMDDYQQTLNIYLKRLPTPEEVEFIRPYLTGFPGYELLLYQSCTDKPDNYTLHLGQDDQTRSGYSDWEAGDVSKRPRRMQLTHYGQAGTSPISLERVDWPEDAPNRNVLIELDGKYIGVPERDVPNYDKRKMDQPIAIESLRCKLGMTPKNSSFFSGEWHFINYSVYPEMMEHLESALANEGLIDRPRQYFIEEEEVSRSTFADYPGDTGAYVQLGALKNDSGGTVVFQLIK